MTNPKIKPLFIEGGENARENISIEVFANTNNLVYVGIGDVSPENYTEYQMIVLDKSTAKVFLKELRIAIQTLED